jgi:hypothetical protein
LHCRGLLDLGEEIDERPIPLRQRLLGHDPTADLLRVREEFRPLTLQLALGDLPEGVAEGERKGILGRAW